VYVATYLQQVLARINHDGLVSPFKYRTVGFIQAIMGVDVSVRLNAKLVGTVYAQRTLVLSPRKGSQHAQNNGTQGKRTTPTPTRTSPTGKNPFSTASSTGTTPSLLLTWR